MEIFDWIVDYWPALIAAGVVDAAVGFIPDKWIPYIGMVKRLIAATKKIDKKPAK